MSAELFHECAIKHGLGGRLDTARLESTAAGLFGMVREACTEWIAEARSEFSTLPDIHFDFFDSADTFGSYAFPHEGKYFIGIDSGTIAGVFLLFKRMLSDGRLLTFLGDASKESDRPYVDIGSFVNKPAPILAALMHETCVGRLMHEPNDPIRQDYVVLLTRLTFDFLLIHELTHIASGHVDWSIAKSNQPYLADSRCFFSTRRDYIERQALEVEADVTAAIQCANLATKWCDGQVGFHLGPFSQDQLLYLFLFAIFSYMRAFGDVQIAAINNVCMDDYPPFRFRLTAVWTAMHNHAEAISNYPFDKFRPIFWSTAAEVEHAFYRMTGGYADNERYLEGVRPVGQEHYHKLKECWNSGLREQLEKYAHWPILRYGG